MIERPEAIMITLGQSTIKGRVGGYRTIVEEWLDPDVVWYYKMGNLPKHEVLWVYWVIGNKVRFRAKIMEFVKRREMTFTDKDGNNPETDFGNFVAMIDFEKLPRPYESRKGFQGFRYR